ncbi:MAG: ribosome maturation factor RimP [Jiangellaceae bacterium]|nr:ribosome maturation factor RimP [Jiangellaceae bacterium]
MSAPTTDLLRPVVEPVCAAHGLDLEDLSVRPAGRRLLVRVVVDADGGVDLDRCAELSQALSAVLDDSDVLGDSSYTLEVSSPGVSRPLRSPRHWRRNVGRLVRAHLLDGDEVIGRVTAATETDAVLDVEGAARAVSYDSVRSARAQVEFRRIDEVGE